MPTVEGITALVSQARIVEAFTSVPQSLTVEAFTTLDPPTYKLGYELNDDRTLLYVYNDTDLTQVGIPNSLGLNVTNIMNPDNDGYCRVLPYPNPSEGVIAWQVELTGDGLYILQLVNETSRTFVPNVNFPISLGTEVYATFALVTPNLDQLIDNQLIPNANRLLDGAVVIDYNEFLLLRSLKYKLIGEYQLILNQQQVDYTNIQQMFVNLQDKVNFPTDPNV